MDDPTPDEVAKMIHDMGLPTETPAALADQILKRARQLADKRGWSVRHALEEKQMISNVRLQISNFTAQI
jgi:hypothetical protein